MSKRSNPIGFRLGLLQLWNSSLTDYGKNFKGYTKVTFKKRSVKNYINQFTQNKKSFGNITRFFIHNNYWKLIVYSKLNKTVNNFSQKFLSPCFYWSRVPIFVIFYTQKSWINTAHLLINYIKIAFKYNKLPFKIFINLLEPKLKSCIKAKITYSTIQGIKIWKIIGIKICCKGRIGSLRNPLTQTFKKSWGVVSLSKISNYVDYAQSYILTKQGIYGVQVWIFYSN